MFPVGNSHGYNVWHANEWHIFVARTNGKALVMTTPQLIFQKPSSQRIFVISLLDCEKQSVVTSNSLH
jgi:hypothetical protein